VTDKEILEKIIQQAKRNGYRMPGGYADELKYMFHEVGKEYQRGFVWSIIFSRGFAKKFWGERPYQNLGHALGSLSNWQWHLQIVALEQNPLRYLQKFLGNNDGQPEEKEKEEKRSKKD